MKCFEQIFEGDLKALASHNFTLLIDHIWIKHRDIETVRNWPSRTKHNKAMPVRLWLNLTSKLAKLA